MLSLSLLISNSLFHIISYPSLFLSHHVKAKGEHHNMLKHLAKLGETHNCKPHGLILSNMKKLLNLVYIQWQKQNITLRQHAQGRLFINMNLNDI